MSFGSELLRTHVGHPYLDRAKALCPHAGPICAYSLSDGHGTMLHVTRALAKAPTWTCRR